MKNILEIMIKLKNVIFKKYDLSWYVIIIQGIFLLSFMLLEITPDLNRNLIIGQFIFWGIAGIWNKRITLDGKVFNLGYSVVCLLMLYIVYIGYNLSMVDYSTKIYNYPTMIFLVWFILFERAQKKKKDIKNPVLYFTLLIVGGCLILGTLVTTLTLFLFRDSYMGQTDYMKYENINFASNIVFLNLLDKSEALDFINKLGYEEEKVEFILDDTGRISEIKLMGDLGNKKIEELNNIRNKDDMKVFRYIYLNKLEQDKTSLDEELSQKKIQVGELDYYTFEIGMSLYVGNTKSDLNQDSLKKKESIEQYLGDINYIYSAPENTYELDWYPTQSQLATTIDYVRNYKKTICDINDESLKCSEPEDSSLILEEIKHDNIFK